MPELKFVLLLLILLTVGCGRVPESPFKSGELVVATANGLATYYLDAEEHPVGFEHDLAVAFAKAQGWTVTFKTADSPEVARRMVSRGEAHIAAAGLSWGRDEMGGVRFGPAYETLPVLLVCANREVPRNVEALAGLRVEVPVGSDDESRMRQVWLKVPKLRVVSMKDVARDDLLERVANGLADCTLADKRLLDIQKNFFPNLQEAFSVGEPRRLAWVVSPRIDASLVLAVRRFFAEAEKQGLISQLRERYFAHIARLDESDVVSLLSLRTQRLPSLKSYFVEAAELTGFDWRLLAAVAYQESQWNARARSSTYVRGIMMLTEETADHLGVTDRTDPRQSILGGARYLAQLRDALPQEVQEPDRTWFALAAYNIGPGHLEDAMHLARKLKRDPYAWQDMKDVLPLLARPQHVARLSHGYARGGEARALTENIRIYYDILRRYERDRLGPGASLWERLTR